MLKLNKQVESLYKMIEKIERRIEELEEKENSIEEKAADDDREMTTREWNLYEKYDAEIENLEDEKTDIFNAIDYLEEYAD